ncbi:MAG: hypothetical protein LBG12_02425 [Synergistaceae bacterium]|jgi:hypothetical protein|nr:hypothetical protein [Synergistaceae bacterium]
MLTVILKNFEEDNINYRDGAFLLAAVLYPCVSFSVSFVLGCASFERRSSGKWILVPVMAVFAGLADISIWQRDQYKLITFNEIYRGATVADYVNLDVYHPANELGQLAKLDAPADFQIADNFPVVDGATAFYPMYAAILNETYNLPDKTEFRKYLACSKTPEAYDRLIRGEADVIFVLQPSDDRSIRPGARAQRYPSPRSPARRLCFS